MKHPIKVTTVRTEAVGEGLGLYDQAQGKSYVLNGTSALVFQHCDGQTSQQQLAKLVQQKFNVSSAEAERLTSLALAELDKAKLLQPGGPLTSTYSRRELLKVAAAVGLSLALMPVVSEVVLAGAGNVFPTLQCVENNGDGTYTAYFGYINDSSDTVVIPYDPSHAKNMFTSEPKYRGQPDTFLPGAHEHVFSVVFDGSKITWMIKEDNASRQKVDADANSGCTVPPPPPTTTMAPPTTTMTPPTTTMTPPTTTMTPPTTTMVPPTTTPVPTTLDF